MKRQLLFALVLAFGLTLRLIQFASAHAFIDHCTPAVGSTVAQAPKEIRCTFTQAVDAKQTVFAVYDAKNYPVDNKDLKSDPNDKDGKTVVITLNAAKITNGLYTVTWETVSEDGDKTDGQWQFSVGTGGVPSVSIVSPTADTKFDKDPADVVVTIKANNFTLGQGGRRWQVYLDDNLMIQVTDGATTTTLKAVPKGEHALKVALAMDDKTIIATTGMQLGIGEEEQMKAAPTAAPAQQPTAAPTAGADNPLALALVGVGALLVIGVVAFLVRRR